MSCYWTGTPAWTRSSTLSVHVSRGCRSPHCQTQTPADQPSHCPGHAFKTGLIPRASVPSWVADCKHAPDCSHLQVNTRFARGTYSPAHKPAGYISSPLELGLASCHFGQKRPRKKWCASSSHGTQEALFTWNAA